MKRCLLTVMIIAAMMMSITACSTNNENSSNALSSKSSSSTSSSCSSSAISSKPEPKPEMRSFIKQKIDTWYSKHNEAQKANSSLTKKYGDFSNVPDAQISTAVAELDRVVDMLEEAKSLLNELMDMEDVMNVTEKEYFLEKLKIANG